jgi:hypothetical protein
MLLLRQLQGQRQGNGTARRVSMRDTLASLGVCRERLLGQLAHGDISHESGTIRGTRLAPGATKLEQRRGFVDEAGLDRRGPHARDFARAQTLGDFRMIALDPASPIGGIAAPAIHTEILYVIWLMSSTYWHCKRFNCVGA